MKQRGSFESRHTDRLSARIKVKLPRGASSLEQMHLLYSLMRRHASTKQRCEIQCEALAFSDEHTWLCDLN